MLIPFSPSPAFPEHLCFSLLTTSASDSAASADLAACRGWLGSQLVSLLLELEPFARLRPQSLPLPASHPPASWLPILLIHLAPLGHTAPRELARTAATPLRLAERFVARFAAWPDRPAGLELRCTAEPSLRPPRREAAGQRSGD